jgi:hypothetical protein
MATTFDLTDVPFVAPEDLAIPMRLLIDGERALALLYGAADADMRTIEEAFWLEFEGDTASGIAVLLRFRSLLGLFAARRPRDLLLDRGHGLIAPAVAAAATMRLNARWGFNPYKFLCALTELEAALVDREARERAPETDGMRLAA